MSILDFTRKINVFDVSVFESSSVFRCTNICLILSTVSGVIYTHSFTVVGPTSVCRGIGIILVIVSCLRYI
jgi:hypothetical protein